MNLAVHGLEGDIKQAIADAQLSAGRKEVCFKVRLRKALLSAAGSDKPVS